MKVKVVTVTSEVTDHDKIFQAFKDFVDVVVTLVDSPHLEVIQRSIHAANDDDNEGHADPGEPEGTRGQYRNEPQPEESGQRQDQNGHHDVRPPKQSLDVAAPLGAHWRECSPMWFPSQSSMKQTKPYSPTVAPFFSASIG